MLGEPQGVSADTEFRNEVAEMIVEVLVLDDVTAADIEPYDPLFGEGLGLDSLDALELSFAIAQRYGVKLRSEDDRNREIFASLDALSRHIDAHRVR